MNKEREMSKEPVKEAAKPTAKAAALPPIPAPHDAVKSGQQLLILLATDWLDNDRTHAAEIQQLLNDIVSTLGPPVNRDVPHVYLLPEASEPTLTCTMGNWDGEPFEYEYEWHKDGVKIGASSQTSTHVITADDAGHGLACVVTATNHFGSVVAPMSNTEAV
jgi:hypothetical protein